MYETDFMEGLLSVWKELAEEMNLNAESFPWEENFFYVLELHPIPKKYPFIPKESETSIPMANYLDRVLPPIGAIGRSCNMGEITNYSEFFDYEKVIICFQVKWKEVTYAVNIFQKRLADDTKVKYGRITHIAIIGCTISDNVIWKLALVD